MNCLTVAATGSGVGTWAEAKEGKQKKPITKMSNPKNSERRMNSLYQLMMILPAAIHEIGITPKNKTGTEFTGTVFDEIVGEAFAGTELARSIAATFLGSRKTGVGFLIVAIGAIVVAPTEEGAIFNTTTRVNFGSVTTNSGAKSINVVKRTEGRTANIIGGVFGSTARFAVSGAAGELVVINKVLVRRRILSGIRTSEFLSG